MQTRSQLRAELKQRRHDAAACQRLSKQICEQLRRNRLFTQHKRLALYYAVSNEVDLTTLCQYGWALNKTLFLPVLSPLRKNQLCWIEYRAQTHLHRNKYNIPEPVHESALKTKLTSLDIILMPLVGFDSEGNRLGMGGGYYDRSLSESLHPGNTWQRPVRVGVAYSWQQVERIPNEKWDIPLDAVVTERGVSWFKNSF